MTRQDRAKQFMPFDTLKGLHDALKMKEYEHERIQKSDLDVEKAKHLTKILLDLSKKDKVEIKYYEDGHYKIINGNPIVDINGKYIEIHYKKIPFDDIFDITRL